MEGGIEDHGLGQLRIELPAGLKQAQRGRVMDGGELLHFFQLTERLVVDDDVIFE